MISWDVMGYHGISWEIMGFHGISLDIMGYHGISCDFLGLSSPFVIFQLFGKVFAFPIFWGLSSPNCLRFVMNVFVFPFFLWAVQPRLYRFWCLLVCVLQIFFGCPAHSSPKLLEGISSLQILEGLFPKKSWREYPNDCLRLFNIFFFKVMQISGFFQNERVSTNRAVYHDRFVVVFVFRVVGAGLQNGGPYIAQRSG